MYNILIHYIYSIVQYYVVLCMIVPYKMILLYRHPIYRGSIYRVTRRVSLLTIKPNQTN